MKSHPLSQDIISTLPSHILENILCLLPIHEAARTSILSKEWRYKWTKIPKLEFADHMFESSTDDEDEELDLFLEQTMASQRKHMGRKCKLFFVIYQVLLMRQAPIHEFALSMLMDKTCVEINHVISYLSRSNTVKKLELRFFQSDGTKYLLPLSVFSWHHLTDLHLYHCDLKFPPTFNGFGSLTSLYLEFVYISTKSLLHLLSNCPLLKRLALRIDDRHLVDKSDSTITELFECLPLIEVLSIWRCTIGCFVIDSVSRELPTSLIHLKYFYMRFMSFADDDGLCFLALLMRCSPNLEKIRLETDLRHVYEKINSLILERYTNIWLEHLSDLEIYGFATLKFDLEFLRFILAKSPKLKKVQLFVDDDAIEKNVEMLNILLRSPPASPLVEITVDRRSWFQTNHF